MKSLVCCLLLLTTICYADPSPFLGGVGTPELPQKHTLHVGGVPMVVWQVTINVHQLGCSVTGSDCNRGPQVSFWIQDGPQAKNCSVWQKYIPLLQKRRPVPYPYLELLVTPAVLITTDEGQLVYPANSASCSGVLDWTNDLPN